MHRGASRTRDAVRSLSTGGIVRAERVRRTRCPVGNGRERRRPLALDAERSARAPIKEEPPGRIEAREQPVHRTLL